MLRFRFGKFFSPPRYVPSRSRTTAIRSSADDLPLRASSRSGSSRVAIAARPSSEDRTTLHIGGIADDSAVRIKNVATESISGFLGAALDEAD